MSAKDLQFANWSPPPINSLTFGTNCNLTQSFVEAWFDVSKYDDIKDMPGSNLTVKAWVPETLPSKVTEEYFRAALPKNLQSVATYGEILQWERHLRDEYAEGVEDYIKRSNKLPDNTTQEERDKLPFKAPYFEQVISKPSKSKACKKQLCSLGFQWDRLGDVTGPGVFINYILLLFIGVIYSFAAVIGIFVVKKRHAGAKEPLNNQPNAPDREGSILLTLFRTAKTSFSGFCDTAVVFSLVLPVAVVYNYLEGGPRVSRHKESMLELWTLIYALTVSVWFIRVGALIRRVDGGKFDARLDRPAGRGRKRAMASSGIFVLALVPNLAVIILLLIDSTRIFGFEEFWDDRCEYGSIPIRTVYIGLGCILGYCILRVVVAVLLDCFPGGSRRQQGHAPLLPHGSRKPVARRIVARIGNGHPRMSNFLGVVDVFAFMAANAVILWYYNLHRNLLADSASVDAFKDGWTLGQFFAVTSTLPVVIGFVYTFTGIRQGKQS